MIVIWKAPSQFQKFQKTRDHDKTLTKKKAQFLKKMDEYIQNITFDVANERNMKNLEIKYVVTTVVKPTVQGG